MDLKKILFGAVVVIILYIFFTTVFADKTKSSLTGTHNAWNEPIEIKSSKLKGSGSNNYTYSFWIYINDYNKNYGEKKMILERSKQEKVDSGTTTPTKTTFHRIYLGENQNDIHIEITYKKDSNTYNKHEIVINSIPLQKWNHIIMTKSGNTIDIYIDGKLVKTSIMPKVALRPSADAPIIITGANGTTSGANSNKGFSGYLSKVNYYSTPMNTREAYQLYKEGYGGGFFGSFFNRFKLKFAFMQDNQEKSSFIL
jgi:hypothetical protein